MFGNLLRRFRFGTKCVRVTRFLRLGGLPPFPLSSPPPTFAGTSRSRCTGSYDGMLRALAAAVDGAVEKPETWARPARATRGARWKTPEEKCARHRSAGEESLESKI